MDLKKEVKMWEEQIVLPTYEIGTADKNPMFLEKRVYQGSSGRVYPYPVIDKIYDEKVDKTYNVVFLENEYLKVMIMPELGGRIQRAFDKTNQYDFVYYNQVIKPALVGLTGPWISGGIEFNWPQHHRPNTFGPVDYKLEENEDGSKTVWVSEVDRMYGTKGMAGFTLYPDKAYIEIKGQLYNRTPENQTFLWWANPAVAVNDYTQSVFPPDVHAVMDHGKRDVSKFPIATGTYYKMDYSEGVDISRYKNIPVPTSYMAYKSDYNFVGGYDNSVNAGILHVANHHISPGKKQWTWGCGEFGQAWDRNLTDEDGPYIELMTGVYTDNQPDFSWLSPHEEKTFTQYFMPYKNIGMVKNATTEVAVNLEIEKGKARIGIYTTASFEDLYVTLEDSRGVSFNETISLDPNISFNKTVEVKAEQPEHVFKLTVRDAEGKKLISYQPKEKRIEDIPEAAKPIGEPETLKNTEALYLAAKHLEQYRHATYRADDYYLEGLKRDPEDIRLNNAYGALLLRKGLFMESEKYFRAAVKTATRHSPNPYDGEPYYNLGLSLWYQEKYEAAYSAFYKATWNAAFQHTGYYFVAQIDAINKQYALSLEHIEKSLVYNYHSSNARNLKSVLLRKLGRLDKAIAFTEETLKHDKLDLMARYEISLSKAHKQGKAPQLDEFKTLVRDDVHTYIMIAQNYAHAGLFEEAVKLLELYREGAKESTYPMVYYYMAYYFSKMDKDNEALKTYQSAEEADSKYCFPNSVEDKVILEAALKISQESGMAAYYLGNLLYDKNQFEQAGKLWEQTTRLKPEFPTAYRNLSLYYYNKKRDEGRAKEVLEKAFSLNTKDARVFLELDQLYKKLNISYKERIKNFEVHTELVQERDDLFVEYVTLVNLTGDYAKAKSLIAGRKFHPWEGGEGKITKQYKETQLGLAKDYIQLKKYDEAVLELQEALIFPENLGEGRILGTTDNDIYYYLGICYKLLGDSEKAQEAFKRATLGINEPASAMFYNDQPPEVIFYQGLAHLELGEASKAKGKFNKLIDYGEKHMFDEVKIDYFAVSLPDFLIFEDDLNKRNKMHCHYLIGLGKLGMGNKTEAEEAFKEAAKLDVNHQGVRIHQI